MSAPARKALRSFAAAVVPAGMAAAFAFQVPAAAAAPAAAAHPVTATRLLAATRTLAPELSATGHRKPARHLRLRRLRAYAWARHQAGHPYSYGGIGPGYDCSGLVMMAYRHAGIHLPRTTTGMLASRLLVRVRHPRMGDLAFYGSGHVELFRKWGYTFGAHDAGSVVSLVHYGWGWVPTAFYRVR
jgi:cell wall-associated NlpC family hydrolase